MNGFFDSKFKLLGENGQSMDPFLLPSSSGFPTQLRSVFDLSAYMYYASPLYRQGTRKVAAYMITDLEFDDSGDREEQKWLREFMLDELRLFDHMLEKGEEWGAFGNSLTWIYFPFDRKLFDSKDHLVEYDLSSFSHAEVKFDINRMQYQVPDPTTRGQPGKRKRVWLSFRDRVSNDITRIRLMKLDPRRVELHYHQISGRREYYWRLREENFYQHLREGKLFYVNDTPLPMLRAVQAQGDFLFGPDQVFHLRQPTITGIDNAGWGLPEVIANYRNVHMSLVYQRIDESIGLDHMLPMRVFSPNVSGSSVGEVSMLTNLADWTEDLRRMVSGHRSNPFDMHALPFPVTLQELGGNGKQLAPKDSIAYHDDRLLDGAGFPAQLQRGDLQWQAVPITLRLFENSQQHLMSGFARFVKWVAWHVQQALNMSQLQPKLGRPRLAEDAERRSVIMQLVASGELPRESLFTLLSIDDPVRASKRRLDEDMEIERNKISKQKEFEREQTMGSLGDMLGEGGAAGAVPAGAGLTPGSRMQDAEEMAKEWGAIESDGQRRKAMEAVRSQDAQLYALAKQKMEEMRASAASAGRAQAFG
jgi:hypothetical protein